MDKTNFIFNIDKLDEFRAVISDLSKINTILKLKMDNDSLLLYSIATAGEGSSMGHATALAVKAYSFPSEYFMKLKHYDESNDTRGKIDWIIRNGVVLNKRMNFFDGNADIKGVFNLRKLSNDDEVKYTRNVVMTDNKFKFSTTGDEPHVVRDMPLTLMRTILDPELSELSFSIPSSEFLNARTASNVESEDIVTIYISGGKVYFRQSSWELLVGTTEFKGDRKISFHKKYLKSINPSNEVVDFMVFPTFVLYKEDNQKLIISYEQEF